VFRINPRYDPNTQVISINLDGQFTERHKEQFHSYIEDYVLDGLHFHVGKKPKLKRKQDRVCRFCGKRAPEVSFRKTAHIIPELMGNRNLISDCECDSCNDLFSTYEDAFAKFLGISRTLSSSKGREGIPTFKNPDKKLEARKNEKADGLLINFEGMDNQYFEVDESGKKLTIKTTRHPYKPIHVYKALLKIAFGLLPEGELPNYEQCRLFLQSDKEDSKFKGHPHLRLFGYFSPGPQFTSPTVFLWKKKKEKARKNIPTRSMVIYFQNHVHQIFLPFDKADAVINKVGHTITFNLVPPFLDKKWIETFGDPSNIHVDLSESETKINDKLNVTMTFDEAIFKDMPKIE
jgi:hypothetical protein